MQNNHPINKSYRLWIFGFIAGFFAVFLEDVLIDIDRMAVSETEESAAEIGYRAGIRIGYQDILAAVIVNVAGHAVRSLNILIVCKHFTHVTESFCKGSLSIVDPDSASVPPENQDVQTAVTVEIGLIRTIAGEHGDHAFGEGGGDAILYKGS